MEGEGSEDLGTLVTVDPGLPIPDRPVAPLTVEAYLLRIANALERSNELKEAELALNHPDWAKTKLTPMDKPPKIKSVGVSSVEDWSANWEKKRREKAEGR